MFKRCLECNHVWVSRDERAEKCPQPKCQKRNIRESEYFEYNDGDAIMLDPIRSYIKDREYVTIDDIWKEAFKYDELPSKSARLKIAFFLRHNFYWETTTIYRNKKQKSVWREGSGDI